jgi:hypothetical protein
VTSPPHFLQYDESQLDYYEMITKRMPGRVLQKHGIVQTDGDADQSIRARGYRVPATSPLLSPSIHSSNAPSIRGHQSVISIPVQQELHFLLHFFNPASQFTITVSGGELERVFGMVARNRCPSPVTSYWNTFRLLSELA